MPILAIETSCDETGVAVVRQSEPGTVEVLAEGLASQIDVHKLTGGVIPEVAAREHAAIIQPLIRQVLDDAGTTPLSAGRSLP